VQLLFQAEVQRQKEARRLQEELEPKVLEAGVRGVRRGAPVVREAQQGGLEELEQPDASTMPFSTGETIDAAEQAASAEGAAAPFWQNRPAQWQQPARWGQQQQQEYVVDDQLSVEVDVLDAEVDISAASRRSFGNDRGDIMDAQSGADENAISTLAVVGEGEEAVDVAAVASEDASQVAQDRNLKILDAVLLIGEESIATVGSAAVNFLTPEESRPWTPLRAFEAQKSERQRKVTKAQTQLLDELAKAFDRQ
jgi:hypothetical protein